LKINEYLDAAKAALRCRTDSERGCSPLSSISARARSSAIYGRKRLVAERASQREMNHRLLLSLLARVGAAMRRDLEQAFAPLTRQQRWMELLAIAAMICMTIAIMAP